jgi:hypothetical protein
MAITSTGGQPDMTAGREIPRKAGASQVSQRRYAGIGAGARALIEDALDLAEEDVVVRPELQQEGGFFVAGSHP